MKKFFLPISGLALLWSIPFLGQAPAAASAEGARCCDNGGQQSCCYCCPHCGCDLVPQCCVYWTTKKVTTYKYTCICEYICVPGVTRLCDKCSDDGGQDCCKCRLHMVRKLVKIPCVEEVPVKKCTVQWVCPVCSHQHGGVEAPPPLPSAPMPVPAPPAPPAEIKSAARLLPAE